MLIVHSPIKTSVVFKNIRPCIFSSSMVDQQIAGPFASNGETGGTFLNRTIRNTPTAQSAFVVAANLPTSLTNSCGIPIHSSRMASTRPRRILYVETRVVKTLARDARSVIGDSSTAPTGQYHPRILTQMWLAERHASSDLIMIYRSLEKAIHARRPDSL